MRNMGVVYYLMERLRQVVGPCWDYCVIWKLSEDPWLLECVACCCGGSYQKSVEEEEEEVVSSMSCKDVMFPHPRMRCCDLLSQLPPSLPLDGINAEVLISNQPRWLNNAQISDLSTTAEEIMESKVLIPVPGGLVEFYASKMVPEDPSLIDFVLSQSSALSSDLAPYSPSTGLANLDISSSGADATADRIRVCNSALNFLQQFSYLTDTPNNNNNHNNNNKEEEELLLLQAASAAAAGGGEGGPDEEIPNQPQQQQQQLPVLQHEIGRQDSGSDSDPIDDEEDSKYSCSRRKNGKGNQSKNLFAERKRRKKLNERLYKLRSLVPKISKLDRAAILGDAIEYVMELQKLEKDLQTELEHNSDEEEEEGVGSSSLMSTNLMGLGVLNNYEPSNGFYNGKRSLDQNKTTPAAAATTSYEKPQQMEVQVAVGQLDGNEFFIKVFGEQKRGGFVRLMEALDSLGLEITTVNVTSCISLVSYVFTVEKKDSETVQAEYLRESLLEMTRNQSGEWAGGGNAQHHLEQQYQQQYYNHHHPFQPFQ